MQMHSPKTIWESNGKCNGISINQYIQKDHVINHRVLFQSFPTGGTLDEGLDASQATEITVAADRPLADFLQYFKVVACKELITTTAPTTSPG